MPTNSNFITFILGAGASFEVEMPTGHELKQQVASSLKFEVDDLNRRTGGDDKIRQAIQALGRNPERNGSAKALYNAAKLICNGMPQAPSIDNFIDSHRSNSHVAEVGKLSIANAILKAERESTLYIDDHTSNRNRLDFSRVSDTWFNKFFQLISLNAQLEDLPSRFERVKVITFNYDRTLEHFLYHSIQNYYGADADRAAKILSHLTVLHPYGQVGNMPWQNAETSVPFGDDVDANELALVAKTLRTFTEGTSLIDSQIVEIRKCVFDADILTFLGFAYHELNLQLLFGTPDFVSTRYLKRVFGTAKGLSESNKKAVAQELVKLGRFDSNQITLRRELTAAELLPEYSWSLRVPNAD